MSETQTLTAARTPTVYFIDDSATMREVIKIAFRKENIHIVTCPDAASALAQFCETAPDAVITDVIMPDQDGYEVCQFIKQHEQFGKTPVILMSGVVNRTVAEKAMAVKADELIRKPFQPHDLIVRVKSLLYPKAANIVAGEESGADTEQATPRAAAQVLSGLFSASPVPPAAGFPATSRPDATVAAALPRTGPPVTHFPSAHSLAQRPTVAVSAEIQKLRNEIHCLEFLVKKLQAELEAEHQYCIALEAHIKTLQESE
jgi:CheY-like chemotaxis protein